jgi:hypothetical protein
MERGSDKHSAKVDDQLQHETADLTHGSPLQERREDLAQEASSYEDLSPDPGQRPILDTAPGGGLPEELAGERAEMAAFLRPREFPATSERLVQVAEEEFAPDWVIDELRRLPDDAEFATTEEIWDHLRGAPAESSRSGPAGRS